jgi:hypothetical protein
MNDYIVKFVNNNFYAVVRCASAVVTGDYGLLIDGRTLMTFNITILSVEIYPKS